MFNRPIPFHGRFIHDRSNVFGAAVVLTTIPLGLIVLFDRKGYGASAGSTSDYEGALSILRTLPIFFISLILHFKVDGRC